MPIQSNRQTTFATMLLILIAVALAPASVFAQGEDSKTWERDLQVIATMLPGTYANTNQAYFDGRTKSPTKHRRLDLTIVPFLGSDLGDNVFRVDGKFGGDSATAVPPELWQLSADDEHQSVRMRRWMLSDKLAKREKIKARQLADSCDLFWQREAQQFRATSKQPCGQQFADEYVLSQQQLWANLPTEQHGDFKLHRTRAFECYADIPGVGGGRDEPYDRYDNLKIHDHGGQVWFTSKENRRLSISLLLVDWPINNYKGVFTRDSFVIYVSEELVGGEVKELGYAFTEPDAERIGINLKWMLASCFMQSNRDATPSM